MQQMQPIVITYDNEPNSRTDIFLKTLSYHGWNHTLIGKGETWKGFISKMQGYSNAIQSLPDEQVVVLSDARDVLCVRSPLAFLGMYRKFGKELVVSMEMLCGGRFNVADDYQHVQCIPLKQYWEHYNINPRPARKYVNSGIMVGTVRAFKQLYAWIFERGFTDDQFALGSYMNTFPERVAADTDAILSHTTVFGVNAGLQHIPLQAADAPSFAEFYGRAGFFLHVPGIKNGHLTGQEIIYNQAVNVVLSGANDNALRRPYPHPEPDWNWLFD